MFDPWESLGVVQPELELGCRGEVFPPFKLEVFFVQFHNCNVLRSQGHEMSEAKHGGEIFFASWQFVVVVVDLVAPELNGVPHLRRRARFRGSLALLGRPFPSCFQCAFSDGRGVWGHDVESQRMLQNSLCRRCRVVHLCVEFLVEELRKKINQFCCPVTRAARASVSDVAEEGFKGFPVGVVDPIFVVPDDGLHCLLTDFRFSKHSRKNAMRSVAKAGVSILALACHAGACAG